MSTNIFIIEFKRLFKSTMFWTFFICFLIVIDMVLYVEMMKSGMFDQVLGLMESPFIGDMMKGFGVNPEQITNILGFYVMRNTMIQLLVGGIYASIMASSIISLEEYEKTSEFLLSKPVTRTEVMNSKILAYHSILFLLNLISCLVGYISLEIFKTKDYSLYSYFVLCVYTYLLCLVFGSIGLFFSLLVKRGRVFVGAESAKFIGYFSPFKFVDKEVLRPGYNFDYWNVIYFIGISLVLTLASYRIFQKKDVMV